MKNLLNFFLVIILISILTNCNEKISYSGKILDENEINYTSFKNKNDLIAQLGSPNFIDPIEKKFYYFSEQKITKNFYENRIKKRTMLVFNFNQNENIISFSEFSLDDEKDINFIEESTKNSIVKQGLIKKIFGGIGKTGVPNTSR